ncbi:MAG: hypothetical protein FH756_01745 [Firmicutes bacterium]|nr:hypothetical protein [Bacillota bacterium]
MAKLDKTLETAKQHLEADEEVLCAVMGAYETKLMGKDTTKNGAFIATNKRLVFFGPKMFKNYDMEVFPYENISSIEMGKGMMGHKLTFFASGNKASMKWIQQGDIQKLIETVKSNMGKKEENTESAAVGATTDIADQIKKLADLKEAGILTEEEFQSKKGDLLAKM